MTLVVITLHVIKGFLICLGAFSLPPVLEFHNHATQCGHASQVLELTIQGRFRAVLVAKGLGDFVLIYAIQQILLSS